MTKETVDMILFAIGRGVAEELNELTLLDGKVTFYEKTGRLQKTIISTPTESPMHPPVRMFQPQYGAKQRTVNRHNPGFVPTFLQKGQVGTKFRT